MSLLKANDITKTYLMGEVQVHALSNVSIEIRAGELICLLGYSGSGKSTLLNLLGGLDRPSTGTITFNGERIDQLSDRELTSYRRREIGFIFQMYNLIPRLTAQENVELVTEISEDPMDSLDALDRVGLSGRASHFPSQLSGGEQQRVAIARAIAKRPRLLFCDEPTGALDVETGIKVLDAIQEINRELGTTVIVISHNTDIAQMADRVVTLRDGKIWKVSQNLEKKKANELEW